MNLNAREAAVLVALGTYGLRMRLLPFVETLAGALDKVRGALSASAQRELLAVLEGLDFVGVPALPAPEPVRRAVEEAWFGRRPLRVRYRRASGEVGERTVTVAGERHTTQVICDDVHSGERRHLRLDRIEAAGPASAPPPASAGPRRTSSDAGRTRDRPSQRCRLPA